MIDSDTGKRCNAAQVYLVHNHGSATGRHLGAIVDKSILPTKEKEAVRDVFGAILLLMAGHPDVSKEGQFYLLEELCDTLFESFEDYRGKFKSLA